MFSNIFRVGLFVIAIAPASALGWSTKELRLLAIPDEVTDIEMGELHGEVVLTILTPTEVSLFRFASGKVTATKGVGGQQLLLHDLDGNGQNELLLCTSEGVQLMRGTLEAFGDALLLAAGPCDALVAIDDGGVTALAIAGEEGVKIVRPIDGVLSFTDWPTPSPVDLLAAKGKRLIATMVGSNQIFERTALGPVTYPTGGAVGSLTMGPDGWTWTIADQPLLHNTSFKPLELSQVPTSLASADLDSNGVLELVLGYDKQIAIIDGEEETTYPAIHQPAHLSIADIDGDSCPDIAIAENGAGALLIGDCGAEPIPTEPLQLVTEAKVPAIEPSERILLGQEWMEVAVPRGESIAIRLVDAQGWTSRFDALGLPPGLAISNDILHGTIEEPGDYRVTVTLYDDDVPRVPASGFTIHIAEASEEGSGIKVSSPEKQRKYTFFSIRSCMAGVGGAAGLAADQGEWANMSNGYSLAGSPAFSVVCSGGGQTVRWLGGVDTAPIFVFPYGGSAHVLMGILGMEVGNDTAAIGPYASAGLVMATVGLRGVWTPYTSKRGRRHGIDIRAAWIPAQGQAFQAMVLYTWSLGGFHKNKV